MSSRSSSSELALQLGGSLDHPSSGTKRERSPSPELGFDSAGIASSRKAEYSRKKSKNDVNTENDGNGPTSEAGNERVIADSQHSQEQRIIVGKEEVDRDTRSSAALEDDENASAGDVSVGDAFAEDASPEILSPKDAFAGDSPAGDASAGDAFAGDASAGDAFAGDASAGDARHDVQISNPASLPYSVTGRLVVGSSVYLELAKNQYLHVTVHGDREGNVQDSGQAIRLKLFFENEDHTRRPSEALLAPLMRQPHRQRESIKAFEEIWLGRKGQAQADAMLEKDTEALRKNDQMDLDIEID